MARKRMTSLLLSALAMLAVGVAAAQAAKGKHNVSHAKHAKFAWHDSGTTTPIKHLVVVFQENVSFDHYFATYPYAANPPGEPRFAPKRNGFATTSSAVTPHQTVIGDPQPTGDKWDSRDNST